MGNCFQPKSDSVNSASHQDNPRVATYAASIHLRSSEYISSLVSSSTCCCLSQENTVTVLNGFSVTSFWDAAVGTVKSVALKDQSVFASGKVIRHLSIDGARLGELTGHDLPVTTVDCSPQSDLLASGSRDYTVRIWDIPTYKSVATSKINWNVVTCVKWLPTRQLLVQCSEDMNLRLWDVRERPMRATMALIVGNNFATRCDVSEDYILTAHRGFNAEGCEAKLWDVRQEKLLTTFSGHSECVESAVFCEGKVFTCSKDGGIRRFLMDGTMEEHWQHPSKHPFLHMVPYENGLLAASSPATMHFFTPLEPQLLHAMGNL